MTPAFASWAAFVAMGGYAFYVWLAVAATLLSLAGLLLHTLWQRRVLLAAIRRRQARLDRLGHGAPFAWSAAAPVDQPETTK